MRKLIWPGIGLIVGAAFAAQQFGGFWDWVPEWLPYGPLHLPAIWLTGLGAKLGLARGDAVFGLFLPAIVLQWVLLGTVVGLTIHLLHRRKRLT